MITIYNDSYKKEVIDLISHVQNVEYGVGISLEEQQDILNIDSHYIKNGGNFWVALNEKNEVVGTIGLEKKTYEVCILKKFFVYKAYRGKEKGVGADLFEALLNDAEKQGFSKILLDTPSVATRSHSFYEKVGFKNIDKKDLPIQYDYPDRNSLIYELNLSRLP